MTGGMRPIGMSLKFQKTLVIPEKGIQNIYTSNMVENIVGGGNWGHLQHLNRYISF